MKKSIKKDTRGCTPRVMVIGKVIDLNYDMDVYIENDEDMTKSDYIHMIGICLDLKKVTTGYALREILRVETRIHNWYGKDI